ncbi:MAG: Rpp14/Pop5 family protein [Halobacteriaceae archaeon]
MRHLPKHLRQRWRYLAVGLETWPDADFDRRAFQRATWYAAQNLLGDVGSADADLRVLRFRLGEGEGEAVVRVRHGAVETGRAVVACVHAVDGHDVGVHVRGVSGTVRACEEKYMGGPTEKADHVRVTFRGADRPAVRRGGLLDVETDGDLTGATRLDTE